MTAIARCLSCGTLLKSKNADCACDKPCIACEGERGEHEPGCRESPDWEPSDDDLDLNGEGVAARDEAERRACREAGR